MSKENYQFVRDSLLFLGGLAGVVHETVMATSERPALLMLFAVMMGLTAYARTDDARKKNGKAEDDKAERRQGERRRGRRDEDDDDDGADLDG